MQKLNLPPFDFRIKVQGDKQFIFDSLRKKFLFLTPEEWVRQNFIQFLVQHKRYPQSLMAVEKQIAVNGKLFRFDLVVYRRSGQPFLIAEFKAPGVKITQQAFDQVVRYNMALKVKLVIVSNGLQHFICAIDYEKGTYNFLKEIPEFGNKIT
ncbi:MAG: type I restriction enzyme HsdR N-terminal domain-containing protein [Tangfeifania sp.]